MEEEFPRNEDEAFDLNVKPGDVFSVGEKRRMLTLMELEEWREVAAMVIDRALRGWADDAERSGFVKSELGKTAVDFVVAAGAHLQPLYWAARFHQLDEVYMQVALLAESWRSQHREE